MFRSRKNPADEGRVRLSTETSMRDLQGLKELVVLAGDKRGTNIELPWTSGRPGQMYILTVIWDRSKDDPVWTLYDELDGKSTPVWSEAFPPTNVELVYDILVMSTGASTAKAAVPENLKTSNTGNQSAGGLASKFPPKNPASQSSTSLEAVSATPVETSTQAQQAAQPAAAAAAPPPPPPPPPPAPPVEPQPPPIPVQPTYSYPPNPGAINYQGQPQFQQPGPPQPYPVGPGYPPMQPTPYMFPQQPMGQPLPNAPGFLFPPPQMPLSYPPNQPANWSNTSQTAMPIDASLLNKHYDILLGELLTRAEVITEPTLEAALKLKDLVQEGKLASDRAPEILKTFFSSGGSIEDYMEPSELSSTSKQDKGKKDSKKAAAQEPKELPNALKLLIKSGVLADGDLKMANDVQSKHGGVLSDILQAAGKVDKNTMEAALNCASLEKDGLLKLEQCIIALNYCMRSRVTLDEAIEELNWENPRKKGKAAQSSS